MPRYRITDSTSGRTLLVEGDAPPTEADAEELFATSRAVAVAPPPDSANAAQSIDESANRADSPAASSWRNPYALDTGRPIVNARELGEPLMRFGLPLAAGLLAPVSGGASIPLGLAAAGAFTGEVLAQESEMARGARDQASYGQMVAAPIIAGTPLGPAFKGAAYAKDALIAARPAAIATRAAFGGGISAGANALAQKIDTGEVDSAQVLAAGGVGALFGGGMGALETATTTRAMKAALFAERKRTGDFKSTDLDLVGKMQRSWQRGRDGRGGPRDDGPDGGAGSVVPDQARPVDQVQLPPAGLPPFDPTRSARDIVLPPVPPRPSAPVAPVPPSAPAQVAPPEPLPAPVDNAPVVAPPAEPATTTALSPQRHPVVEFPVKAIQVNKDIQQFKGEADSATGVVDALAGKFERLGTAPIVLWEKNSGETEVITGRHRLDLARRSGETTIPAQVVRESDGFTQQMALTFDAESNIRDGQGTVKDYAHYFRNSPGLLPADADARGLRARAKGQAGWALGRDASDDLYTGYANGQITEAKAVAIATGAPGRGDAQASAMRQAKAMTAAELNFYAKNLARLSGGAVGGAEEQLGFGGIANDFAAFEAQAAKVAAVQAERLRQNNDLILAAQGAATRPDAARKMGLPVDDPAALNQRIAELKNANLALQNPNASTYAELARAAGIEVAPPPQPVAPPPAVEAPPQDPNQIDMFGGEPPSVPPTKLDAYNNSALLPPPEKLDLPMQPEAPLDNPGEAGMVREDAPARLAEPAARVPGTPADEFGALHGPKLSPDTAQKFRDMEFQQDLGTTDGIDYKIETRRNKLWLTASKVSIKGRGAGYVEQGIAYLHVDPAGNTILGGSFANPVMKDSPLAIAAKAKMIAFINDMAATSLPANRALDNPGESGMVREDAPAPQNQNPAAAAQAVGDLPGAAGGLDLPNAQGEAPAVALSRPPRGLKEIEAAIMRGTIDRDRAAALFNRWFDVQAGKAEWMLYWDKKGNPAYLSITDAEAQALSRAVTAFDQGTAKFKWPSNELHKKGGATGSHWSDPGPNDKEAGRIDPQLLFPLARAVVGGIAGYLEGDTPEEKLAFALAGGLGLGLLGSRRLARRTLAALKPARAPVPSYLFDPGKPLRAVNAQGVVVGSHTMGALEHVRAIEMPELVHLARQLSGNDVGLRNFPKASGKFYPNGPDFRIELDRRIFSDPVSAQRTMAHELGHMIDYLDDQTMNRGNLLGRIAVLRDHLRTTLPDTPWNPNQALQPKERVRLRRDAEKAIGKRPPQDEEAELAAWKQAVAERYAEDVANEIESRGLLKDQEIRAELIGITEWWRPYEADKVSAGYIDYRNSSVELYADALSVLFNAPSELRDRAPLFFDSWMSYLDRKPEAKRALQDAWHFLHQGQAAVVAARDDRIKAGFVKAEEFLINHARERELDRTTLRGIVDQTKQEWWNIYQPIIARGKEVKAAGVKLPWHKDPEFFFDAHALAENENYLLLERLQRTVVAPLEASGQTREDLGLYLFHNRVLNERYTDREGAVAGRSVIANPDGITPIQARMKLMLQRVPGLHSTPEQRVAHRARLELLESSARQVQDAFADLVRNGHQAGVFSDAQLALTEANRYAYAPFAVVDYLLRSDHVPAGIKQQVGTLQKVANPYLTFVLKGMAVAKLTELNRAKTLTVDLLNAHFPDSIERAPERKVALADGSMMNLPPPPAPRGKTTLTLLRKGKLEAYYVEPAYTKMFDDQMPASAHIVAKTLNYTMRNFFHPLFITYNPGFVYAANPMSDNLRSYYALPPGAARRKWIAENRAVWESARSRVAQDVATQDMPRKRALVALRKQRPLTPPEATELKTLEARGLAYEAIATRALASPADSFAADAVNQDDLWSRMLREHALLADEPGRVQALTNKYLPTVVKTAKMIERHGMMSEALPKLAAYGMLGKTKGWSKEETAFYVRNQIGTPNVYKKGSRAVFNGSFLPYINVFTRGMEADVALLRGKTVGPESRSRKAAEFWRRMTEASFVPSLLQALAMVGVFGAALKKVYDGFSDYDKTNYLIIPLGTWETDTVYGYKSAGIRIRLTETMRFVNAFLQYIITRAFGNDPAANASLAGLFEFGAGQVPGVHPLVTLGNSWAQFASGIQPRDSFRGSPVVQTADWKAGGWDRTKGMLAYTWGESGLGGMVRFDPKSQNIMEFSASATPVVNRLIRWSDSGLREREERIDKLEAEVIYKIRSQMPKVVNELLQEYSILKSMGERRDDRQEVRYKDLGAWHLKVWEPTYKEMKEAKPKDWSAYGVSLGIDSAPYGRGNQK